jgi:hypothetical protein
MVPGQPGSCLLSLSQASELGSYSLPASLGLSLPSVFALLGSLFSSAAWINQPLQLRLSSSTCSCSLKPESLRAFGDDERVLYLEQIPLVSSYFRLLLRGLLEKRTFTTPLRGLPNDGS